MASRLRSGEESILGCRLIEDSLACWRRTIVLNRVDKISAPTALLVLRQTQSRNGGGTLASRRGDHYASFVF